MNTTYPLWFECFQSAEKTQKASLPAPAACLYPSQWFTPTQLLYLINKRLAIAANFAVLTLERPRQALAGYQLWQQETAPRQHWENSSCKSQKQKRTARARCFQPALFSIWAVCAAVPCQRRGGEGKKKKRKERSNKEVDISLVHSRALNTFLLHFNGFLKSIFMQIKACLSHEFTKARPGARLRAGLPESSLVWGGCNLPRRDTAPWSPSLQRVPSAVALDATPMARYHTLRNYRCSPQPRRLCFLSGVGRTKPISHSGSFTMPRRPALYCTLFVTNFTSDGQLLSSEREQSYRSLWGEGFYHCALGWVKLDVNCWQEDEAVKEYRNVEHSK